MPDNHPTPEEREGLISLRDCPPGVFRFNDMLGFKTEYGACLPIGPTDVPGDQLRWSISSYPDAYCLDSGEFFWGGVKTHDARAALLVEPVAGWRPQPPERPKPEVGVEEIARMARELVTTCSSLSLIAGTAPIREFAVKMCSRLSEAAPPAVEGWRPLPDDFDANVPVIVFAQGHVGEAQRSDEAEWWWANQDAGDYHARPIYPAPEIYQPLPAPPASRRPTAEPEERGDV